MSQSNMHPYAAPFNYYYSTPYGQMGMNPMPMNMLFNKEIGRHNSKTNEIMTNGTNDYICSQRQLLLLYQKIKS